MKRRVNRGLEAVFRISMEFFCRSTKNVVIIIYWDHALEEGKYFTITRCFLKTRTLNKKRIIIKCNLSYGFAIGLSGRVHLCQGTGRVQTK